MLRRVQPRLQNAVSLLARLREGEDNGELNSTPQQCFSYSRNISYEVTLEIIHFHYLKNVFSGSKYPKIILFNFENKSTAPQPSALPLSFSFIQQEALQRRYRMYPTFCLRHPKHNSCQQALVCRINEYYLQGQREDFSSATSVLTGTRVLFIPHALFLLLFDRFLACPVIFFQPIKLRHPKNC